MNTVLVELKNHLEMHAEEDTQYILVCQKKDSQIERSFTLILDKEGISAEIIGLYKVGAKEQLKIETSSVHKVPNTSCLTKIMTVLMDNSYFDYTGKIIIDKSAQQTNAYLQDDVLVIGENVKNNSSPILQIDANDVKASHGATTGRIRSDQVYYLMSRGFIREEAERFITEGFFSSLINTIIDDKIREIVRKQIC